MTRHALRTLVRSDHGAALELLGYPPNPEFRLSKVVVDSSVSVGDALTWSGELRSATRQKLRIGLRIHYLRNNGSHSPKLFAMQDIDGQRGERYALRKVVKFRPATTRTLYPGTHFVELVVNGVARGRKSFELVNV